MHWLLCHVGEFIRRHGFWGVASEHIVEHVHHVINEDFKRRLKNSKVEEKVFRQVVRLQVVRNFFFDTRI